MKKLFCRTKILIILIMLLIFSMSANVYSAYTDGISIGAKYKFNGSAWCVFQTLDAAEEFDNDYLMRYLENEETITVKEKKEMF